MRIIEDAKTKKVYFTLKKKMVVASWADVVPVSSKVANIFCTSTQLVDELQQVVVCPLCVGNNVISLAQHLNNRRT